MVARASFLSAMLTNVKGYIYERKWRLTRVAGAAGGVYICGRYALDRLEELRYALTQEKLAREDLQRRFQRNQLDANFTIMTLVPTLGERILREMDVESITQELQLRSRQRSLQQQRQRQQQQQQQQIPSPERLPPPPPPSESSLASSVDLVAEHADDRSDNGSLAMSLSSMSVSAHGQDDGQDSASGANGGSSLSWADQLSVSNPSPSPSSPVQQFILAPPVTALANETGPRGSEAPESMYGSHVSDSVATGGGGFAQALGETSFSTGDLAQSTSSLAQSEAESAANSPTRSKAELWKEVKLLTFTRTLTVLYSTTLLSLLTVVQLSILGRSRYVQAVMQQVREELPRDCRPFLSGMDDMGGEFQQSPIAENVEMAYLTLSWWVLHVGWKDVGERVRRAVEEVFDNVSLKTKMGPIELHRLVGEVRRLVDYEITFEGKERRISFLSALLPPTTETLHRVLSQGGVAASSMQQTTNDPTFQDFLIETREVISSRDFAHVLEVALDRATAILFESLEKNVFVNGSLSEGGTSGRGGATTTSGGDNEIRLAGLLPCLARWCHLALNGLPNELIDGTTGTREVSALSAIIFARFEDRFCS